MVDCFIDKCVLISKWHAYQVVTDELKDQVLLPSAVAQFDDMVRRRNFSSLD